MTQPNTPSLLFERIQAARDQFPEYRSALIWIIRNVCTAFPWAVFRLAAYSMIGASLQGAILVAAVRYIGYLEKDTTINLGHVSFAARDSEVLLLASAVLFLLLCLSAWIMYLAGAVTSRLIADYHTYLLKRVLTLFGTVVPDAATPRGPAEALRLISKIATKDAQRATNLVRFFASSLPNLIVLSYSVPILAYIDATMTVILFVLAAALVPFFYHANILAYRSDLMAQRSGSGATQTFVSLLEDMQDYHTISPGQAGSIDKAFTRGDLQEKTSVLPTYYLAIARTDFWTNILLSLSISLVIIIQVGSALAGETTWAMVIAYLTFLRLAVNSFRGVMSFLNKFSRYYPYVQRYQNFVRSAQADITHGLHPIIKPSAHGIYEETAATTIMKPTILTLISDVPMTRYTFPYMVKPDTKSDNGIRVSPQKCFFLGDKGLPQRDGSVRGMLRLPKHFTSQDLEKALPQEVVDTVTTIIGNNLDKHMSQEDWEQIEPSHRVQMGIAAAMLDPAPVVVLNHTTLHSIPEDRRQAVLSQLKEAKKLIVVRYPEDFLHEVPPDKQADTDLCAVANPTGGIIALGSTQWTYENREQIQLLLEKEHLKVKKRIRDEADIDEDDDD